MDYVGQGQGHLDQPWANVREGVQVKRLVTEEDIYVLAQSDARIDKERGMRRKRLRRYIDRLRELQGQALTRDELLMKFGAAKHEAGRAANLVEVTITPAAAAASQALAEPVQAAGKAPVQKMAAKRGKAKPTARKSAKQKPLAGLEFRLDRAKLRRVRRREGRYLLRTNLHAQQPERLWSFYIQLTEVEQAFKEIKHDLAVRPIFHRTDDRIEAHIFVAFLAYCLQVTLKAKLRPLASGITPREVLAKFKTIDMVDVHIPTTDGRELLLSRHTQPQADHRLLLQQLRLSLPEQPPPRISAAQVRQHASASPAV